MNTIKNNVDLTLGIAALVAGGQLINLTPHPVNIILDGADDPIIIIAPADAPTPRVTTTATVVAPGFVTTVMGDVTDLPYPVPGKLLIVGALIRTALPDRDDLIGPDTSPTGAVRDAAAGMIIGARGFQF